MPTIQATRYTHPATLADLIHGDPVADHDSHRPLGVVDTVGARYANVEADDGSHHAYPLDQLDLAG